MVKINKDKFDSIELDKSPQKLSEEAQALHHLVESSFMPIIVVGKEGIVLYANQPAIRLFGDESGVRPGTNFKFPLHAGEQMELFVQSPNTETAKRLVMHVMESPWKGRQAYITSFQESIFPKQHQIKSSNQLNDYKNIFLKNYLPIIIHHFDGKIININKKICDKYNYKYDELVNISDIIINYNHFISNKKIKLTLGNSFSFRTDLKAKDGRRIPVQIFDQVIEFKGQAAILCTVMDSAERTENEAELAHLAAAIKHVEECVHVTDVDGVILFVNPAFESITGYSKEEAVGKKAMRLLKAQDTPREHYHSIWESLKRGQVWTGGLRGHAKDDTLFEVEASISPVRDTEGRIVNYVAVMRDVSQEIALERQLRQAQKMEAIGTLAGGIAHDFNNILSAIIGYTELGIRNLSKDSEERKNLKKVLQAGERARDLVKQILTFSRQSEEEFHQVDFHLIIKEVFKLLRSSLPSNIKMHQHLVKTGKVLGDPTQLHQVVMNLCTNASQAMIEKGGTLTLSLDEYEIHKKDAERDEHLSPGRYARLIVSDTGHGMGHNVMERIFEPYFTTKEKGKGTGLGLSVVHGIVQRLSGLITVSSEIGKGSTFTIFIPVTEEEMESVYDTGGSISLGFERVLVVDDEKVLTEMTQQMLEHHGYYVEAYTDSKEALERFRSDPYRYDIVLTDMTMPDLTGDQLAKEMLEIRPELPIVLCTGFSERITEGEAAEIGIRAFALKPLVSKELVRILRTALDNTEDHKEGQVIL